MVTVETAENGTRNEAPTDRKAYKELITVTDPDDLGYLEDNRKVNTKHYEHLQREIEIEDLLAIKCVQVVEVTPALSEHVFNELGEPFPEARWVILDGQHRAHAYMALYDELLQRNPNAKFELPVEVLHNVADVRHVIRCMNINQRKWSLTDYVHHYARIPDSSLAHDPNGVKAASRHVARQLECLSAPYGSAVREKWGYYEDIKIGELSTSAGLTLLEITVPAFKAQKMGTYNSVEEVHDILEELCTLCDISDGEIKAILHTKSLYAYTRILRKLPNFDVGFLYDALCERNSDLSSTEWFRIVSLLNYNDSSALMRATAYWVAYNYYVNRRWNHRRDRQKHALPPIASSNVSEAAADQIDEVEVNSARTQILNSFNLSPHDIAIGGQS